MTARQVFGSDRFSGNPLGHYVVTRSELVQQGSHSAGLSNRLDKFPQLRGSFLASAVTWKKFDRISDLLKVGKKPHSGG